MRNTLQEQYNLLKEGKGNKQQFFKSARHLFPNLITPVNTYEDTVCILKNRGIIAEGIGGVVTKGKTPDWHQIFKENMSQLKEDKKEIISQLMGPDFFLSKKEESTWDDKDMDTYNKITKMASSTGKVPKLNEAKEAKAEEKETTKEVTDMATRGYDYKDTKNYNNVFGQEFLQGFYTEMQDEKNKDKDVDELRAIVAKNLAKDLNHYVKDGQFGIKGVGYTTEAPGLGTPKEPKGKHKSSGYGDLKESVMYGDSDGDRDFDMEKEIEANEYYDKGLEAYAAGDLSKAEKYYQAALKAGSWLGWTEQDLPPYEKTTKNPFESLQESVLRSQIYLLVKEVLSEGENDHMGQYRLGVLKKLHSLYPDDKHLKKELGIEDKFKVGDTVTYKGDKYEITRFVDDRIYIKSLTHGGRPDSWVKASDLQKEALDEDNEYEMGEGDIVKYKKEYAKSDTHFMITKDLGDTVVIRKVDAQGEPVGPFIPQVGKVQLEPVDIEFKQGLETGDLDS